MAEKKLSYIFKVLAVFSITFLLAISSAAPAVEADENDAQAIVDKAWVTFNEFMRDSNYTWFHEHLKDARGLLIFPQVLKAGFFVGASGGTGVLVVRNRETGDWNGPAFYTVGAVSFGLQIGGEASQVVMMVMSPRALDSLFASSFKLGGDTSIAIGPVGIGAKANITTDFISFTKTKGIYAGVDLEGSVVDVRDSLNEAYYGKDVTPLDIVVKKEVYNKGSDELIKSLKKAVK